MPRGQYDRSKTKEQRAAEKASAAKKPGKAQAKSPAKSSPKKYASHDKGNGPEIGQVGQLAKAWDPRGFDLHNDQQRLASLTSTLATLANNNNTIQGSEIGETNKKLLARINQVIDRIEPDASDKGPGILQVGVDTNVVSDETVVVATSVPEKESKKKQAPVPQQMTAPFVPQPQNVQPPQNSQVPFVPAIPPSTPQA